MTDGYENPEALVETTWLAKHLEDPTIRVLDATYCLPAMQRDARSEYEHAHIPGAVFFDIDAIAAPSSDLPHMLPEPEAFAAAVGALGIGNDHRVIVYDSHGLMSAARVWWMFRVFGHDPVAVLNGGLVKWLTESRPVESGTVRPQAAQFSAQFRPALVSGKTEIHDRIGNAEPHVIDARAAERFRGEADEVWPGRRRGHIPGSHNLPFTDLVDTATKTVLPADAIRAKFADANIDLSEAAAQPWTCSCGSGITACVVALGAYLVGHTDTAVYDGSWAEWGLPGDTPVSTAAQ